MATRTEKGIRVIQRTIAQRNIHNICEQHYKEYGKHSPTNFTYNKKQ